jgi:chemosensory pili system protein ChpA (sensor histidine kinase/response regulator)
VGDFDPEILHGFVAEARSYLVDLGTLLERAAAGAGDNSAYQEGYRLLHCMRGAASMLALDDVAQAAGEGEALLESVAAGARAFDGEASNRLRDTLGAVERSLALVAPHPPTPSPIPSLPPGEGEKSSSWSEGEVRVEAPLSRRPGGDGRGDGGEGPPPELIAGFLQEAEEHLAGVNAALRELARDPRAAAPLQEIRRRIHTLKGTAGMMGFAEIAHLSHALEDSLEPSAMDGEEPERRLARLQETVDALEDLVRRPDDDLAGPAVEQVRIPLERISHLVRVAGELLVQRSVLEQVHRGVLGHAGDLSLSLRRLRGLAERLESADEAAVPAAAGDALPALRPDRRLPASAAAPEFDELEMDRYTERHLLTRGLTETTADLGTVGSELGDTAASFEASLVRQQRLLRELQEGLLRLRAVPLAALSSRLHRTARTAAAQSGREAELILDGGAVELDKSLFEEMADPLIHLVRNAVGHGIEAPDERRAHGKPAAGTIRVAARYQGGQAVLTVEDDGAGVDLAAVRATAAQSGLLAAEAAAALSDDEALALLFLPGFTTARSLSEISGRGVGLDIVKAKVESLRGTLSLDSTAGQGTRFTLRLPLSLAVTRALLVRLAGHPFAVPATAVARVLRAEPGDLHGTGDETVLTIDGEDFPVRPLSRVLGLGETALPDRPLALLLDLGDYRAAFLIDELIESREVVVKPLGPLLRRVDGLAGATLLGDGRVVPILDPYTFPERAHAALPLARPAAAAPRREVLIVDDSLSVRRVMANLITQSGWLARTAKDGLDALDHLQQSPHPPAVILLDVEMPRMDGYELTATLRGSTAYQHIPIVMITSRAGAKHRDKAFALGVSDYIVKPFEPEVLLHRIARLTAPG